MVEQKKRYYQGVRMAPYDLVKELLMLLAIVSVLVIIFAAVLSSPDVPPLTVKSIALSNPASYVQTALNELDGQSGISTYGPPYNHGSDSVQYVGPISVQQWFGVHIPINTAQDYVLGPLAQTAATNPTWKSALRRFNGASAKQQSSWENAYNKALSHAKQSGSNLTVPSCACGPVHTMMAAMLSLGQSGAMDGLLLTSGHFYQTDYTRPLLFTADPDNDVVAAKATSLHLQGSQWGVMNETGNYPGQAWLWLYTLFYQIPPYTTAWGANADALAVTSVAILSLILLFLPWIPGLNRVPRWLGVYRLIWKDYYRGERANRQQATMAGSPAPTGE